MINDPRAENHYQELRKELATFFDESQLAKIDAAYNFAADAHIKQRRISGEPYITHPIAVCKILFSIGMDYESIMVALLHDVIEDTSATKQDLVTNFGQEIANLVDGVSKLKHIEFESREEAQAESFRKMLLAMVKDIRVIIIKMADRLHNMQTIGSLRTDKKNRIARETLEIYAPIANRLGMHGFKVDLEELSFRVLFPYRARVIEKSLRKGIIERKPIILSLKKSIKEKLKLANLPHAVIKMKELHTYGVYQKIRDLNLTFDEILDSYHFQIEVENISECYQVLGILHTLYKPILKYFKDYIAIPKKNGYQSIHTTLVTTSGMHLAVQIRTHEMYKMAENGVAAYWLSDSLASSVDEAKVFASEWFTSLMDMQQKAVSSLDFVEDVKSDLYPDEIYVFTPKTKIIKLPRKSTVIDFAYAVHTDIGNKCIAAKINNRLVPLSTTLKNSDKVEIITAKDARPNIAWLNFSVTGKARNNIKSYFKTQQKDDVIVLGEKLLINALDYLHSSFNKISEESWQNILTNYNLKDLNDLYTEIGFGKRMAYVVALALVDEQESSVVNSSEQNAKPLLIEGTEGLAVTIADCCCPLPGDSIIGVLKLGEGIVVHHANCSNMATIQFSPSNLMHLNWNKNLIGIFKVKLVLEVFNETGLLAKISNIVTDVGSNISEIKTRLLDQQYVRIYLEMELDSRMNFDEMIRRLKVLKQVIKIYREGIKK